MHKWKLERFYCHFITFFFFFLFGEFLETFEKNQISDIFIMKAIEYQRVQVQTLHGLGHSVRLIMAETGKSKSFVERWISRDTIDRHPVSGRPL